MLDTHGAAAGAAGTGGGAGRGALEESGASAAVLFGFGLGIGHGLFEFRRHFHVVKAYFAFDAEFFFLRFERAVQALELFGETGDFLLLVFEILFRESHGVLLVKASPIAALFAIM